ncbi:MAG: RNA methyltransferase [Eudoraea sp.]
MNKVKQISSLQNPLVKKVLLLKEKSRERRNSGLFVLEGQREFELACKGGYTIQSVFFCPNIISEQKVRQIIDRLEKFPELIEVSQEIYQKIAYRESTEGIVAIACSKNHHLNDISFRNKNPLILIAEAPEKPGNVGALLRTADAAKLDAVIIVNSNGDLYNPNVIRASVGCLFTVNIATGNTQEVINFLHKNKIAIYSAALSASCNYTEVDYKKACAIVVGTEATGLSSEWLKKSDQNVVIPMQGEIDSMNVSVSAAILIFEAKRQREFL